MAKAKVKKIKIDAAWCIKHRATNGMTQTKFWSQYGISQSGGCRYERGRQIPLPVRMLIALETGMATMEDLITGRLAGMV